MDRIREKVARAICVAGRYDPDQMMANGGPRWKYYVEGADAAIATLLAELDTPSKEMVEHVAASIPLLGAITDHDLATAAIQSIAAHIRAKPC